MPSDFSYDYENVLFDQKNRALSQITAGRNTDVGTVQRLLSISRTWNDIQPGVAYSLAASGFDAHSPETKQVAQLAVAQRLNQQGWRQSLAGIGSLRDLKSQVTDESYQNLAPAQQHAIAHRATQLANQQLDENGSRTFLGSAARTLPAVASVQDITHGNFAGAAQHAIPGSALQEELRGAAGSQIDKVPAVGTPIKSAVRTTALAAQTPLDILNASIRTGLANAAKGKVTLAQMTPEDIQTSTQQTAEQTTAYQHYAKGLSVGDGYLPSPQSPAGLAASEAARQYGPGTIGGHAFTPGRYLAAQFGQATHLYEPDSEAFNILSGVVDAGLAIKMDPTAIALGAAGDAREAAKTFNPDTGLLPTTGAVAVDQNTKTSYLLSNKFTNGVGADITADTSPASIWRKYPTLPVETVHGQPLLEQLARSNTIDDTRAALSQATEINGPLDPPGFSYKLRRATDSRLFATMPRGSIADAADKNVNVKILDDVMRGFNIPIDTRNATLDRYITNPVPLAALDAVTDTLKNQLRAQGWDEKAVNETANFFRDAKNRATAYAIDQTTGHEYAGVGVGIAGEGHVLPTPTLSTEELNSPIHLMDLRTARRMTGEFPHITGSRPWEISQTALAAPAGLWKPLQVLTARMMTRIFGETQMNLALRGMDNAFTHPIRFMSLLAGMNPEGTLSKALQLLPRVEASYLRSPEMTAALGDEGHLFMNTSTAIYNPETVATKGYMSVPITHERAQEGFAEQLAKMHGDPIMRGLVEAPTPEAGKEWFWSGTGGPLRIDKQKIARMQDEYMMQKSATDPTLHYTPIGDIVNDRAAADRYLDERFFPRLRDYANTDELRDAVKTGKLAGVDISTVPTKDWERANVNQTAANRAREILDEGNGPQRAVVVRQQASRSASDIQKGSDLLKFFVDKTFHALVDVPDHVLNRSPAFKQARWEKITDLLPYADTESRAAIEHLAEEANLPKDVLARLKSQPVDVSDAPRLNVSQVGSLSKANALDKIRLIVHDLTTHSQFFDMTRMLFPFGDAFRLVAQRMVTLAAEEPQTLRRLQQGIQGAQGVGSAAISKLFGDPVPHGQGFFHKDAYGQDVFSMPGSTWLDKQLLGVPIPLNVNVKGLTFIGEGYPGLGGPTLTVPAKWFLPHTPAGDKIRDIIFPYGNAESQGVGADLGQAFMPSYLQKLVDGPIDQRSFNNKVNTMLQILAQTGEYQLQGPNAQAETLRLMQDARQAAKFSYVVAGAAQFLTPGAPNVQGMVQDKTGRWAVLQVVTQKYHDKVHSDGPDAALNWLLQNYGTKNFFLAQKATQATGYASPVTKEGQQWVDAHPGIRDKYPLTYGLFAPTKGHFDITTYDEQFAKGERKTLSPAEQIAQAEQRLGFYVYDRAQQTLLAKNNGGPLTTGQKTLLSGLKAALAQEYPGFNTYTASPYDTAKRRTQAINEITGAVDDPAIANTDAGQGVQKYLALRTAAIAASEKQGLKSPFSAKKALPLRNMLRAAADKIIATHPDFRIVWDSIFSGELAQDGTP